MKKFLKITGITFLILLIVIIALPFLLKDKIEGEIKKAINEQVNAEVNFGDVSLSLLRDFPRLNLRIDSISVKNLAPFEGVELARIGQFETSINLISAFSDNIKVLEVGIIDPVIDVRVLADGSANYDIAKASTDTTAVEEEGAEASAFNLELKHLFIRNATVKYDDVTMPISMEITGLNHDLEGDFGAEQMTMTTKTTAEKVDLVFDGVRYLKKVKSDITADFDVNLKDMMFKFINNTIFVNELELKAEGWISMPADDIDMDISFAAPGTSFKQLLSLVPAEFASDLSGVDVSGNMNFDGFVRGKFNDVSMPGFGLNLNVENGRFKYPDLPKSAENIQIKASIDASDGNDYDKMKLDVDRFHVELAGNPVDMTLKLRTPMSDPDINCTIQSQLDLKSVKEVVPMEGSELTGLITADIALKGKMSSIEQERYEDFDARGQLILQEFVYDDDSLAYSTEIQAAYFNFSPQFLDLSQFKAKIGRSDIQANGKIDNYLAYFLKDSLLTGNFNMNSTLLDLNEFMDDTETSTTETAGVDSTSSEPLSVIRVPKNLDIVMTAGIATLIYDNLDIKNVSGRILVKEGVANMTNLSMNLLDGSVVMNGSYDTRETDPLVDFKYDIQNLDIKKTTESFEIIQTMAPMAKNCSGKFSTAMGLTMKLNQAMEPIESTISGSGNLQAKSIYIEGFEPLMKVAETLKIDRLSKQTIDDVKLNYKIEDGKAIVEPYTVKLDGIPTTIAGYTTFSQEINYTVDMEIPFEKLGSKAGGVANDLLDQFNKKTGASLKAGQKIPVNLKIGGTVTEPKIQSNYGDSVGEAAENLIDQAKEQIKEEVNEKIEEGKEAAIKKAREEADKILADAQAQADKLVNDAKTQAEKVKAEGYKQASDLEKNAKGPIEKAGAKIAADKLRKESDNSATKIVAEAQKQADSLMASARKRADEKIKSVE